MNSTIKHYPRNAYLRMHRQSACVETFKSIYEKWLPTRVGIVSKSAIESYRIAYDHIQSIANMPINLIKYSDMQYVIDSMRDNGLSYASAKKVRTLLSLLSKYAIVNDIDIKDYTSFLNLGHDVSVYPHKPFTRQQINRLWSLNTADTYGILILLYTGMRCGELLSLRKNDINLRTKCLIVRQSKTEAGRNRLIPIHSRILPIVTNLYQNSSDKILPISYAQFSKQFKSVMTAIKCSHSTHDCRHTVATLLDKYGASPTATRAILGHKHGDITTKVYTHKELRELRKAIELLPQNQWGSKKNISIGDGYNYDVIFPTAYASICLCIFPVLKRNSVEGGNYTIYYTNESNTGCKLITDESKSSGTAQGFAYFTIGY